MLDATGGRAILIGVKRKQSGTVTLSPCQIVAWNLERARRARGWTQTETARALEPYLGYRLSRAAFSQAESSIAEGHQIRRFDADEIVAFARVFDLTVGSFFSPPEPHYRGKVVIVNGKPGNPRARVTSPTLSRGEMAQFAIGAIEMARTEEDRRLLDALMARLAEQHSEAMIREIGSAVRAYLAEKPEASGDNPLETFLKEVFERAMQRTPAQEQKRIAQARTSVAEVYGSDKPFDQAMLGASPGRLFPRAKAVAQKKES